MKTMERISTRGQLASRAGWVGEKHPVQTYSQMASAAETTLSSPSRKLKVDG